jgi:hypothetical protein
MIVYSVQSHCDSTPVSVLSKKIASVLNDRRGWKKYGVIFREIKEIDLQSSNHKNKLRFIFRNAADTEKMCQMVGLSCYIHKNIPEIIINEHNWNGGSHSSLPIDRYQTYLINHEVGHFLGLSHSKCPIDFCKKKGIDKCRGSIMQQMSRGPNHIYPCLENEWPITDVDIIKNKKFLGGFDIIYIMIYSKIIFIAVVVLLLIMMSYFILNKCSKTI